MSIGLPPSSKPQEPKPRPSWTSDISSWRPSNNQTKNMVMEQAKDLLNCNSQDCIERVLEQMEQDAIKRLYIHEHPPEKVFRLVFKNPYGHIELSGEDFEDAEMLIGQYVQYGRMRYCSLEDYLKLDMGQDTSGYFLEYSSGTTRDLIGGFYV